MKPVNILKEIEEHTVDNDPAWAAAVAEVNKEHEEAKPEIIEDLKRELASYVRACKEDGEEINSTVFKAYQDAIKDPDDIWCECTDSNDEFFKEDGEVYLGVSKHAYICPRCMKYVQIG